jgi:hypothetical protein
MVFVSDFTCARSTSIFEKKSCPGFWRSAEIGSPDQVPPPPLLTLKIANPVYQGMTTRNDSKNTQEPTLRLEIEKKIPRPCSEG